MSDKKTFLDKIQEIGTCEDEVKRRSLLAELNADASSVFDENENFKKANEELKNNNNELMAENMKLFRRIGFDKDPKEVNADSTGVKPSDNQKTKFEDLFDEKGGTK